MILTYQDCLALLEWVRSFDYLNRGNEVPEDIRKLERKMEVYMETCRGQLQRPSKMAEELASYADCDCSEKDKRKRE